MVAWLALAAIAAGTERLRLGPVITPLARRLRWKLAREVVSLDDLSRGCAVLGIGLAEAFGGPLSSARIALEATIMKPRHVVALALVGWYPLVQRVESDLARRTTDNLSAASAG